MISFHGEEHFQWQEYNFVRQNAKKCHKTFFSVILMIVLLQKFSDFSQSDLTYG